MAFLCQQTGMFLFSLGKAPLVSVNSEMEGFIRIMELASSCLLLELPTGWRGGWNLSLQCSRRESGRFQCPAKAVQSLTSTPAVWEAQQKPGCRRPHWHSYLPALDHLPHENLAKWDSQSHLSLTGDKENKPCTSPSLSQSHGENMTDLLYFELSSVVSLHPNPETSSP